MKRVPSNLQHPNRQRGAAMPVVVAAVIILILLAVAAWFLIIRPNMASDTDAGPEQAAAVAAAVSAAPPPANVSAMGVNELLNEAKKAMNDKRFIAPTGNNAFEYYLKVLEKRPGNMVAQDALRETFPFGASAAEQDINANNFDEAQREIDLLAKADPGNYTLTILRSKLDAQRKLASRAEEQQKRADELASQQQAQPDQSATGSESQPPEDTTPNPPEQQQQVASQSKPPPKPADNTPPRPATPAPAGPTRAAKLISSTRPQYPSAALRRRLEGWVDVEFTVGVDGNVSNAHSVGSNRGRVFERAAVNAVDQWKFEPALVNGKPVAKVLRQRIQFNL
ncbi:MAG: energy transducer TonB [Rhodanobacteraceae bacterium]